MENQQILLYPDSKFYLDFFWNLETVDSPEDVFLP